MNVKILLITMFFAVLTACGGGGGGGTTGNSNGGIPAVATYTGQYIDSPTKGLFYRASPSGLNGVTDSNGSFSFQANDTISFQIQAPTGNISAGTITPVTPANTSTPVIVSVLNIPNGITIAQTLQSLGGTGSTIDVSYTTPSVSALNSSDVTALNGFISSGGASTQPPQITISSTTASLNATKSLSNLSSASSNISTVSGLTAFNTYAGGIGSNNLGMAAQGLGGGFGYFEASGKLFNICSYQPPTIPLLPAGIMSWEACDSSIPVGGQLSSWTVSTVNGSLQIVETITAGSQRGSINTVTSSNNNATSGAFTNTITNSPTLPSSITQSGFGMYTVVQSDFSISRLSNKTIVVSGETNCSDGKMRYVVNSAGTSYTKTCNSTAATGSTFTSNTGVLANLSALPGIVTFTDSGASAANIKYVGITIGSDISAKSANIAGTGTAAVVTVGSPTACNLTNKISCGIAGLFSYTIQ